MYFNPTKGYTGHLIVEPNPGGFIGKSVSSCEEHTHLTTKPVLHTNVTPRDG